jgi:hypothetical protein
MAVRLIASSLAEFYGRSQPDLALALQRSVRWISRRLALVRALPESIQVQAVLSDDPARARTIQRSRLSPRPWSQWSAPAFRSGPSVV